jgi:hypothetical protein
MGVNTVDQIYVTQDRDHWYCPLNTTVREYKAREIYWQTEKPFLYGMGQCSVIILYWIAP